jgi:hypothetical protein
MHRACSLFQVTCDASQVPWRPSRTTVQPSHTDAEVREAQKPKQRGTDEHPKIELEKVPSKYAEDVAAASKSIQDEGRGRERFRNVVESSMRSGDVGEVAIRSQVRRLRPFARLSQGLWRGIEVLSHSPPRGFSIRECKEIS